MKTKVSSKLSSNWLSKELGNRWKLIVGTAIVGTLDGVKTVPLYMPQKQTILFGYRGQKSLLR